jgi:hypothetical protein
MYLKKEEEHMYRWIPWFVGIVSLAVLVPLTGYGDSNFR